LVSVYPYENSEDLIFHKYTSLILRNVLFAYPSFSVHLNDQFLLMFQDTIRGRLL